jgi:cell wall assembly regulator SMI1
MSDAITILRDAQASSSLVSEDGDPVDVVLGPPLDGAAVDALEGDLGFALPAELRRLLGFTTTVDGIVDVVDFSGRSLGLGFGLEEILPACVPIAHDGFGNYWVVDVAPGDGDGSPVYFACHDAPVLLVQAWTLAEFCRELVRMVEPPHASLLDDVHEDRLFDVWRKNPAAITHSEALSSSDAAIHTFAAVLDERFVVVDLREAPVGMGFSWGRYGRRSEARRHGHERIFAVGRPERRGLMARLRGR